QRSDGLRRARVRDAPRPAGKPSGGNRRRQSRFARRSGSVRPSLVVSERRTRMPLVVGVDAGGSRTTAAAQRDGGALSVAHAGAANANVVGVAPAAAEIAAAIEA